jgi:hypothetical protein
MQHSEYERRRRVLERQLHEDLALIRAGHQAKLRALEMLWLASPALEEAVSELVPSVGGDLQREAMDEIPAPPETPTRSETLALDETQRETQDPGETQETLRMALPGGLLTAVEDVLPQLPEVFDRDDVIAALGFEPRRSTLARALNELLSDQQIKIEQPSGGRRMTIYRKVIAPA